MKSVFYVLLATASSAMALNIQLDFHHDEETDQFFSSNPKAKSAVEKAADDLGKLLTNSLRQINKDIYRAANGATTATFDWSWTYINPVTGEVKTIHSPRMDEDTVIIHVGTRNLDGSTLGQGGDGGAQVILSGHGYPHEWIGAVNAAEAQSNTDMSRGGGPVFGTISGSANYAGYVGKYDLNYGLSVGNLWFDADTDNDGTRDSDAKLEDFWHYDTDAPVAAGKIDLYSVALHELLHVMGIGTSQTWDHQTSGEQWLGQKASLTANTSHLLHHDGCHVRSSLISHRISDGVLQEALISPTMTPGTRKELTELDLAFLADLGFETTIPEPVPEPSGLMMMSGAALVLLFRKKR